MGADDLVYNVISPFCYINSWRTWFWWPC